MLDINKEYASKALRFLKIANLLPCWVVYIESKQYNNRYVEHHQERHWSNKSIISNIFGQTKFTSFLRENFNIRTKDNFSVYELFFDFLNLLNLNKKVEAEEFVRESFIRDKRSNLMI